MNFNFGRVGRHRFQVQSRAATDTLDGGTYNLCNVAYILDVGGDDYQTSFGVAVRQDEVTKESEAKQDTADEEELKTKVAAKAAAKAAVSQTSDKSD